jgi:hypothetical protein
MAASVMAATSALRPAASAISSTHSMLMSVESMSKAMSLKSARFSGGVTFCSTRPGAYSMREVMPRIIEPHPGGCLGAYWGRYNAQSLWPSGSRT